MAAPTAASLLAFLQQKEFLTGDQLDELAERSQAGDAAALLRELVRRQWLTAYQANQIAQGSANELILGAYRILDPIGEGGMGKVYKARHVRMHRDVALKVIPPDCLENAGAVSRFYREVRAVSQLSHPNIVTAYEVGQEGKTHYFAMEFVEGIDLARLVKQSGPLPIAKACDYIRQAALGLQHAHEKGLVHRDIKPGNLIIGRSSAGGEPSVKVLDFGLARFEQAGGRGTRLTTLGHVLGTVDYISPEQAGNAREADIRSDIYSLGCALFYLLTGQPPFAGSDAMERMMARVMRPAASVRESRPDVPVELEAIIAKMMAREPGERYATPAEVAAALSSFASLSTAVTARAVILASAITPTTRSTPVKSSPWLIGALAVFVVGVVGVMLMIGKKSKPGIPDESGTIIVKGDDKEGGKPKLVAPAGSGKDNATPKLVAPAGSDKDHEPLKKPIVEKSIINSIGMKLAYIPPGKFLMGSPQGENGRRNDEKQRDVEITLGFYMGVYEVTQQEYLKVMGMNPSWFSAVGGGKDAVRGLNTNHFPVENVSWNDAERFCQALSEFEKEKSAQRRYDLPTEAEWEFACRAGTSTAFHFGDTISSDQANIGGRARRTTDVSLYLEGNALGLYGMHGNVWEWCKDSYKTDYTQAAPAEDYRVLRGGSWDNSPADCRAAFRNKLQPDQSSGNLGFRVICRLSSFAIADPHTFTNALGIKFVLIPKGKSWLGGGGGKPGTQEVTIPNDFYLGKYEVTQDEWQRVMGNNPSYFSRTGNDASKVKEIADVELKRFPVENVSWTDCQEFIARLNEKANETGWVYRLPREAEWEYACRGGPMADKADSGFDFYFEKPTNQLLPGQANFQDGKGLRRTCKVGSYQPNRLGLFDMHGNVWEWCVDEFKDEKGGTLRVDRGGGYRDGPANCRASVRAIVRSHQDPHLGLRLARVTSLSKPN